MLTTQTYQFFQEFSDWREVLEKRALSLLKETFWELRLVRNKTVPKGIFFPIEKQTETFLLWDHDSQHVKGNGYLTHLVFGDEIQLPIVGDDHLVFVVSGKVDCVDRSKDQLFTLGEGEALRVTRTDRKKEYLNLRLKGRAEQNILVWLVIHCLTNH